MSTADDLQRAYQLIKENRSEEAEALLMPILLADSENIDAWWLMAYAVEDPDEVREALNRVLELDPNYSQAPKAREMLAEINAQYPPPPEPVAAPILDDSDTFFGDMSTIDESFFNTDYDPVASFDDDDSLIFDDGLDDDFASSLAPPAGMMSQRELFGEEEDEDIFGRLDEHPAAAAPKPATYVMTEIEEPLDDEARAALEETRGQRAGRGRRWLTMFLFLLIFFAIPIAVVIALLSREDSGADPEPLESRTVDSQVVNDVRFDVGNQLRSTLGADSQAVIAKSSFGDTLYAKICTTQPGPDMTGKIWEAMNTVAQQAPQLDGALAAVGVSVENCSGTAPDTYYRAVVSVADAIQYASGDRERADFQALWKKS